MLKIVDFTLAHEKQAQTIAVQNYHAERIYAPALPTIDSVPELSSYVNNGLGVSAFDDDQMVGFLCSVPPFSHAFRSTDAIGVFSPMGANGAIGKNRAHVYALMYQAAGEKWVQAGASSHAVCLYAHDTEIQQQFFRYGFGMRTADAVRGMDNITAQPCLGYDFMELAPNEYASVLPLDLSLNQHQCESPFFMNRRPDTLESFLHSYRTADARAFAAKLGGKICAYLKILRDGETFIANTDGYIHIGGAFCMPEHRGKGLYQNLINYVIDVLKSEGYQRLGVDFESINPAAWGFWNKHFNVYTYGLVRRIDEHIFR